MDYLVFLQTSFTVPSSVLTNIKKFKWLRERVASNSSVSLLMNHIKDFVLKEDNINLELIMDAMECQVYYCFQRHELCDYGTSL